MSEGTLQPQQVAVGNATPLGQIEMPLAKLPSPAKYKLVVEIADTPFENDWDVWVYPSQLTAEPQADVLIVSELNDDALDRLEQGGKVLLMVPPTRVKGDSRGKVGLGFSSIFWNTVWTDRQLPHTLGILCDPKHPLFSSFPTEFHSNWQWWYLINRGGAMILDELPTKLRPIVQVIDDWVTNRRLGLVFEAKLGAGKLLVSSIDLESDMDDDPVRRQFRHSLLKYMGSDEFAPEHEVTVEQVRALMTPPSPMDRLGAIAGNRSRLG
jgi:hypothetical protein